MSICRTKNYGGRMDSSVRFRDHNRSQVLAALGERGAITRPQLVEVTGLSRSTISDLVSELLVAGTVHEQTVPNGAAVVVDPLAPWP